MDTVRQWWLDAAWPNVRRLRWFIAAWIVLALVAIPWGVRAQERSLEAASREALVDTGIAVDDVAFTGRNGVVTASITASERTRAADALDSVAGIGTIEWQVTAPVAVAPTTTTTTTTTTAMPVGEPATLGLKVQSGRLVIRGVLPNAAAVAAVGAVSETLYGPEVGNGLTVDGALYAPGWLPAAPDVVALLPMAGDIEVVLDGDGVHLSGTVPTDEAKSSLRTSIERVVGPDVPIDFSIEVEGGGLPAVLITDVGDGTASILGTVSRRKLADEIAAATAAASEDTELLNELTVAKDLAEVYLVNRLPNLIAVVGSAAGWQLGYEDGLLTGLLSGEGLFRGRRTEPSARGDKLIDELAALLIGNPDLVVSIEISTPPATESDLLSTELARRRGFAILSSLVQSGVEPDRITTSVADAEGEVLRFMLAAADR